MDRLRYLRAALSRGLLFLLLWWSLVEGATDGLPFATATVAVATGLSLALLRPPPWRLHWLAAPSFLVFFLREMLRGGIDVARRAYHPRLPIKPGFIRYRMKLGSEGARLLMTWTVGLLPGTVSIRLHGEELRVHMLDDRLPVIELLTALEERIRALLR